MDAGGQSLFVLEPAMGFGRTRLIMAPMGVAGARLPSGVYAVEGFVAVPCSSTYSSRRLSMAVAALPRGGGRVVPDFLFGAPEAGNAVDSSSMRQGRRRIGSIGEAPTINSNMFPPYATTTSASRRSSQMFVAALPTGGGGVPAFVGAPTTGTSNALDIATHCHGVGGRVPSIVYGAPIGAGAANALGTSSTGRRGVGSIRAAFNTNSESDNDDHHHHYYARKPTKLFEAKPRSKRDIGSWINMARLRTMFEVAFDAGVLESGSDLRRVLDAIGDIDITAPGAQWELCCNRVCAVIGEEKLKELLDARTPFEDKQFGFIALGAQSMIEATENLMVILHSLLHPVIPNYVLCNSCPIILKQLLKVVCDFSTLIETTKFKRPQNSIYYPMMEAHARALEHLCVIVLDVYEEACQEVPKQKWAELRQQLRHRRTTLFEQDIGLPDYVLSIGVTDTERVCDLLLDVAVEVKFSAGSSN